MKKLNVSDFLLALKEDLDSFEHYQLDYAPMVEKTTPEWVDAFLTFAGFNGDEVEEDESYEEYDDEQYYSQDLQYEELVSKRKYRSFRESDEY